MNNFSSSPLFLSRRCLVARQCVAFLVGLIVMSDSVWADDHERADVASLTIQEFFPEVTDAQGALAEIIESEQSVRIVPATWRLVNDSSGAVSSSGAMTVVRFPVEHPDQKLGVVFVVIDKKGNVYSRYREIVPHDLPSDHFLDSESLRSRYMNLQNEYQTLRSQVSQNQEQREERKRRARLEASLGQIASLGAQEVSIGNSNKGLPEHFLHAEEVLRILSEKLKTSKPARSLAVREQRLMRHLQELSRVVLAEHSSETYRDSEGYSVEEKIRLIEENRSEHIFLLEQELAELTKVDES